MRPRPTGGSARRQAEEEKEKEEEESAVVERTLRDRLRAPDAGGGAGSDSSSGGEQSSSGGQSEGGGSGGSDRLDAPGGQQRTDNRTRDAPAPPSGSNGNGGGGGSEGPGDQPSPPDRIQAPGGGPRNKTDDRTRDAPAPESPPSETPPSENPPGDSGGPKMGDPDMQGTPVQPSYDGLETRDFARDDLSGLEDTHHARTNETVEKLVTDVQEQYPWLSQSDYAIQRQGDRYAFEFNEEAFTERAVEQVQEQAEEELPWLDDSDYAVRQEGDQFTVDISESSYAEYLEEQTGAERVEVSKTEDGEMVATPFFGDQPEGRMETPGQGPDMRNRPGSDSIYNPTGEFETPGGGPDLWNPEENEFAYDQPEGRVETPGQGPDMRTGESGGLPSVEDRLGARIARQDEDLDPSDVTVTERSAENVTNLDIRADINESPYQAEFSDDYKRDQLVEQVQEQYPYLSSSDYEITEDGGRMKVDFSERAQRAILSKQATGLYGGDSPFSLEAGDEGVEATGVGESATATKIEEALTNKLETGEAFDWDWSMGFGDPEEDEVEQAFGDFGDAWQDTFQGAVDWVDDVDMGEKLFPEPAPDPSERPGGYVAVKAAEGAIEETFTLPPKVLGWAGGIPKKAMEVTEGAAGGLDIAGTAAGEGAAYIASDPVGAAEYVAGIDYEDFVGAYDVTAATTQNVQTAAVENPEAAAPIAAGVGGAGTMLLASYFASPAAISTLSKASPRAGRALDLYWNAPERMALKGGRKVGSGVKVAAGKTGDVAGTAARRTGSAINSRTPTVSLEKRVGSGPLEVDPGLKRALSNIDGRDIASSRVEDFTDFARMQARYRRRRARDTADYARMQADQTKAAVADRVPSELPDAPDPSSLARAARTEARYRPQELAGVMDYYARRGGQKASGAVGDALPDMLNTPSADSLLRRAQTEARYRPRELRGTVDYLAHQGRQKGEGIYGDMTDLRSYLSMDGGDFMATMHRRAEAAAARAKGRLPSDPRGVPKDIYSGVERRLENFYSQGELYGDYLVQRADASEDYLGDVSEDIAELGDYTFRVEQPPAWEAAVEPEGDDAPLGFDFEGSEMEVQLEGTIGRDATTSDASETGSPSNVDDTPLDAEYGDTGSGKRSSTTAQSAEPMFADRTGTGVDSMERAEEFPGFADVTRFEAGEIPFDDVGNFGKEFDAIGMQESSTTEALDLLNDAETGELAGEGMGGELAEAQAEMTTEALFEGGVSRVDPWSEIGGEERVEMETDIEMRQEFESWLESEPEVEMRPEAEAGREGLWPDFPGAEGRKDPAGGESQENSWYNSIARLGQQGAQPRGAAGQWPPEQDSKAFSPTADAAEKPSWL